MKETSLFESTESHKTSSTHVETGITYRRTKAFCVLACVLSRVHTVATTNSPGTRVSRGRLKFQSRFKSRKYWTGTWSKIQPVAKRPAIFASFNFCETGTRPYWYYCHKSFCQRV